jgi:HK97 family phage major capsid protein
MNRLHKKPVYERKDAAGGTKATNEPEIFEQVQKEIKAIGDNTKELVDSMMADHKALTAKVDAMGDKASAYDLEEFSKRAEGLLSKQEALEDAEKKMTDRMDALDLAMQRGMPGGGDSSNDQKDLEDAIEHKIVCLAGQGKLGTMDTRADVAATVVLEDFKELKKAFNKYLRKDDRSLSADEVKLMTVASDPDGGYWVMPTMSSRIVERIREMDPIRELASVETIGTDALEMTADLDEADDGWESETVAISETGTPTINKIRIPVHIQSARPRASQQLLDDASINIEQWLANKVTRKFARTEAAAFVTGTGVGRPRGFLTYPAWAVAGTYEFGKIEQINMGHASELTTDGLIDVLYSMVEDYHTGSTWLMNRLGVRDVMKLKDGDGQYIWRPGLQAGQPATILANPVRMSTTVPVVAANALAVLLADWAEAYLIVDRQGISVLRDPYTVKPLVEFYTRKRVGGDVVNFQAIKIGKVSA